MSTVNSSLQIGKYNSAWFAANSTVVLKQGQLVFNETTSELFIGDGVSQLSTLTAINGGSGVQSVTGPQVDDTDPNNPIVNPLGLIQIVDNNGDFFTDLASATAYIEQFITPSVITDKSFNEGIFFFTVPPFTMVSGSFLTDNITPSVTYASLIDRFGLLDLIGSGDLFYMNAGHHIIGDGYFMYSAFNFFTGSVEMNSLFITASGGNFAESSTGKFIINGNIGTTESAQFGANFFLNSTATILANASKYTSNSGAIHGDLQTAIANGCNVQFDGINLEKVSNKQTDLTASATNYPTVNAVNAGLAAKGTFQGFYPGKWKTIPFASVPTGLTGWVGAIIYIPIPIGETQTFTRIGEEVTTGIAGQNIRLALYRSVNGLPATLIEDSGNLSAVTNGLKYFPFTSPVTVNAIEKQVFAAIQVSNNSIGLRVANSVCLNYFNGSGLTGSLFFQTQAFGVFPANATPVAYNNVISPLASLLMQ